MWGGDWGIGYFLGLLSKRNITPITCLWSADPRPAANMNNCAIVLLHQLLLDCSAVYKYEMIHADNQWCVPHWGGYYLIILCQTHWSCTYVFLFFFSGEGSLNDIWLLKGDVSDADKTPTAGGCGSADFNLIALHGIFMFLGWGVLLQLGAFLARYFRHRQPEGWWFKMHKIFQVSRHLNIRALSGT